MDTKNETTKPGRPAIINRETVSRALDDLATEERPKPTFKQLYEHIGGGSMTTLVRVYHELQADQPLSPREKAFLALYRRQFAETEIDLASWSEGEVNAASENACLKVEAANEERDKFIHMRTLLNERAEKAELHVLELKERQELHEQEVEKYRSNIQELQSERESQAVEYAVIAQQLDTQLELIRSKKNETNAWQEKYESEKLMREEISHNMQHAIDRLKDDLSKKAATEKSILAANEELKKNEVSLTRQLTLLEKQISNLLEQQSQQDQLKKDLLARIRERDDDIIAGKKQIDKFNALLDVRSAEHEEISNRCDKLSTELERANNEKGMTLHRLESEKAAHKETQGWSDKTIKYKDDELNELRKNIAGLILANNKSYKG